MNPLRRGEPPTRKHYFKLDTYDQQYNYLRFNIFPDGGVARLRVYGYNLAEVVVNDVRKKPIGGKCLEYSDAHYGHPDNLLNFDSSKGMYDGWETARRLDRPAEIQIDSNGFVKVILINYGFILNFSK